MFGERSSRPTGDVGLSSSSSESNFIGPGYENGQFGLESLMMSWRTGL
jgi:hypothetical protein